MKYMKVLIQMYTLYIIYIYIYYIYIYYIYIYQNMDYNVQKNNLQSPKFNQNNVIKKSEMINITLQPME